MEIIGLLIVAWLGYVVIGGYNKAKTRRYHAVVARARRGLNQNQEVSRPSWTYNKDKINEFVVVVRTLCIKHGVSENYLDQLLENQDFHRMVLIKFLAILEQNNLSFNSQKTAASELIIDLWNGGVEIPPANSNLQNITSFLDTKVLNSLDAAAVAARLYLDANFIHAVDMYKNPNAVSFVKKHGHIISNEAKPFFEKIEVTNGSQYMELNHPNCSVDINEISRFISSFSKNRSTDELILKLLSAQHLIKIWRLS